MSREHEWFVKNSEALSREYSGKYLAIIGDRIAGIGETAKEAFKRAKESFPSKKVSVVYIPTEEETVTLL